MVLNILPDSFFFPGTSGNIWTFLIEHHSDVHYSGHICFLPSLCDPHQLLTRAQTTASPIYTQGLEVSSQTAKKFTNNRLHCPNLHGGLLLLHCTQNSGCHPCYWWLQHQQGENIVWSGAEHEQGDADGQDREE